MADLRDLARWCNGLPDRIDKAASKLAVETVTAMATEAIAITPVDITTAVSNWQVGINSAPTFDLPAIFEGERGSTAPQSRAAALRHVTTVLRMKDPGEQIYLSNLTPYIIDLNKGSSKQAPPGWIERAVLKGERTAATLGLRM